MSTPTNHPACPHCGGDTRKNGKTKSDNQAYRCKECDRRFSTQPTGRPTIGDAPMTAAQRKQRQRAGQ